MTQKARIVLIDRNGETRSVLRLRLRLDGFEVVGESFGGESALDVLRATAPDVVIVDLHGPPVAELRRAAPAAVIVVFSWFADPFTLADSLRHGADLFLDKSSGPGALSTHVHSLLAHPVRTRRVARAASPALSRTAG